MKPKELPYLVQLFKIAATDGSIEWAITNHPHGTITAQDVQDENAVRWQIEQLHRELKRLTGTEQCECRKARSQRNPLVCFDHAWLSLKVKADQFGKMLYRFNRVYLVHFTLLTVFRRLLNCARKFVITVTTLITQKRGIIKIGEYPGQGGAQYERPESTLTINPVHRSRG